MAAAQIALEPARLAKKSYVSRVQELLPDSSLDLEALLVQEDGNKTRIFYYNGESQPRITTIVDVLAFAAADKAGRRKAICVIENISAAAIEQLGSAWDLDPQFFAGHAENPSRADLWVNYVHKYDRRRFRHLDGVFEYHGMKIEGVLNSSPNHFARHCFGKSPYLVQSNTRISYCLVREGLYLFLIDAPLDIVRKHLKLYPRARTTLRLLYATNQGGILIPQLFSDPQLSLFSSLQAFFQYGWHMVVLFPEQLDDGLFDDRYGAILGQPFLYLLSNSLWFTNLRYLTSYIHRVSFEQVRSPNRKINSTLHDLRQDLAFLKTSLTETIKYVPSTAVSYFQDHPYFAFKAETSWKPSTPIESHQGMLDEALQLESFLMETFQLLMSSISVQDSQLSIEQSRRATRLTLLAFIYVPLSFVTGIFGMNIQEVSGTGLSIWVCFVALAVIVVLTAGIFWFLHAREKRKAVEEEGDLVQV